MLIGGSSGLFIEGNSLKESAALMLSAMKTP
jgi:hypothetical protein